MPGLPHVIAHQQAFVGTDIQPVPGAMNAVEMSVLIVQELRQPPANSFECLG